MSCIRLVVQDLTNFKQLLQQTRVTYQKIGVDILNDMQYVTRGAAPFDTGQLTRNISAKSTYGGDSFKGEIGVSSYNSGFDYGVLRHDFPFELGEGSLNKPPVTSPITGETFVVGYAFASEPLMGNAKGYIDYIEEQLRNLLQEYSS
mgnify:CR=1 FL=1